MRLANALFFVVLLPALAQGTPKPQDAREQTVRNLVQAGILMLEGGAYRQFVQTFLREQERSRFEKDFTKDGQVNYEEWGRQKSERLLKVLKSIAGKPAVMSPERACFLADDAPSGAFSFVFDQGGWYIENKSECKLPARDTATKPVAQP